MRRRFPTGGLFAISTPFQPPPFTETPLPLSGRLPHLCPGLAWYFICPCRRIIFLPTGYALARLLLALLPGMAFLCFPPMSPQSPACFKKTTDEPFPRPSVLPPSLSFSTHHDDISKPLMRRHEPLIRVSSDFVPQDHFRSLRDCAPLLPNFRVPTVFKEPSPFSRFFSFFFSIFFLPRLKFVSLPLYKDFPLPISDNAKCTFLIFLRPPKDFSVSCSLW